MLKIYSTLLRYILDFLILHCNGIVSIYDYLDIYKIITMPLLNEELIRVSIYYI